MTAVDTTLYPEQVMIGTANGPGLWIAPAGTPPPASLGAYPSPWKNLGYASDDGVTISGDTTTEAITPWQSKLPIRQVVTEITKTINFTMWQLNADTLALYFDTDVGTATAGAYSFDVRSDSPPKVWAVSVDVKDGEGQFRITYSRANLDSAGDMAITKSAVVPLEVTLSALDDNGVMAHVDVKTAGTTAPGNGAADEEAA